LGSTRNEALCRGTEALKDMVDDLGQVTDKQQQPWQVSLHRCSCIGAIAAPRSRFEIGQSGGDFAHQCGQVVGQHFGCDINDQGLLRQS
jgi:hypothetical protein